MDTIINSFTKITKKSGIAVGVTQTKSTLNKVCEVFISDADQSINDIVFKQGELGIIMEGREFCFISNGNLIIFTNDKDKYSLNDLGELIYTY